MLFSSLIFLYAFLPIVLILYYLTPEKLKNAWLLLASLVFFAWGGVSYTVILIAAILLNYIFGRLIYSSKTQISRKRFAALGISLNIALLAFFKYSNFFTANLDNLFQSLNLGKVQHSNIILPIGISFYTFHCISYLADIYRRKTSAESNPLDLALYVSMFPQLVAGPIIRYHDVQSQILHRKHSLPKFVSGVKRFSIGLGKKVLLANTFAATCSHAFFLQPETLNPYIAWLGIVCYTLQIYCDFSGYSDMAIGLGKMFGFDFKENFNFPYTATSIRDFWRRWHMSLSTFFRDYVYIPLGGNQKGSARTYLNLLGVFSLTGLWHGASWNFVVWGMIHGFFIMIERLGFERLVLKRIPLLAHLYTLFVVTMAWIFFRIQDFSKAMEFIKALFRPASLDWQNEFLFSLLDLEFVLTFCIAVLGASGVLTKVGEYVLKLLKKRKSPLLISRARIVYTLATLCFVAGILFLCTLYLIAGTYNPFIYSQF